MKLSILTATYNRAKYLKRLYESIIKNKAKSNLEIEWIIINDGSTDETEQLVKKFILEHKVTIKYLYQENKGKMNAINEGMNEVIGELIIECDSDDFFCENAFHVIEENAELLLEDTNIYALCFLKQEDDGNISGNKFKQNYMKCTMFDLYFKDDIKGEKILVFNANIRKKYKHELEKNEKFVTEARMYHKMDEKYKILCINEVIEMGSYIEDGYTKNINKTFKESPNGYYMYFQEILQKDLKGVKLRKRIYIIKNLVVFWVKK